MTVNELLTQIKTLPEYVTNSLILKSSDNYGCTYKYLIKAGSDFAIRGEIFIELNSEESALELLNKTAVNSIAINPAN